MRRFLLFLTALFFLSAETLPARSWEEVTRSGKLVVLTADSGRDWVSGGGLHRVVMPIDREQALLKAFAYSHGLKLEYVTAPDFSSLFSLLEAGKGDLISANVAETPSRKAKMLLSEPFDFTREVVFTASSSSINGRSVTCLAGKTGWVLPGTTYAENLRAFVLHRPGIAVRELKTTIPHDELIENVASGKLDYSVLNECDLDAWRAYRSGIRKLFSIRNNVPLVFAAGKNSGTLIRQLNLYILQLKNEEGSVDMQDVPETPSDLPPVKTVNKQPSAGKEKTLPVRKISAAEPKHYPMLSRQSTADLRGIRKRGFIRMLTSNDVFSCYLHRGELCGFEYELAKRFGDSLNLTVITVIPVDFRDLPRYLAEGKGDFIAANFTKTPERVKAYPQLTFCAPYCGVTEVLVGRPNEKITKLTDLAGRKIHVRKGNSYYDTLKKLQAKGIRFQIELIPEKQRTSETLRKVAAGTYDLTVADNTYLQLAIDSGCRVKKLLELSPERPFTWVVRKNNPELAKAINAFFKKENRSTFFNLCRKRYYSSRHAQTAGKDVVRLGKDSTISMYDPLFRKYGKKYKFDWYFLAAQAYQESRFNPSCVNHIGAAGMMQVMPKTAKELGFSRVTTPESGIHAGAKYMSILRDRFSDKLKPVDRLCFSLAAYNAGYGHLQDARRLAKDLKLNPDVWWNQTEKAFALLEDSMYASRTKYGYCRASETIVYVRHIMLQMYHYEKLLEAKQKQTSGKQK